MIVALSGRKQVGKDTSAALLVKELGFTRLAFADALKDLTAKILDLHPEYVKKDEFKTNFVTEIKATKTDSQSALQMLFGIQTGTTGTRAIAGRQWLQNIGVAVRDVLGQDTWVRIVMDEINADPSKNYVITDARFKNELDAMRACSRDLFHEPVPTRVIRLSRVDALPEDAHISENELPDSGDCYDYEVKRDSAEWNARFVLQYVSAELGIGL